MQFSKIVDMAGVEESIKDRNLALEAVRVTEAAAIASSKWIGFGDEKAADQAAVDAMRKRLNNIDFDGTVVIGEGERDKAPMLYIGEKVGSGNGPEVDIALDPLEGTTICATGTPNSLSVIALTNRGGFLHAPDVYMEKIAVGPGLPDAVVDIDNTPEQNLKNLAKAKKCEVSDLVVIILKRDRHEELIAKVREAGARITLIGDGDVAGVIATTDRELGVDMYMGTGGAPEGVLAAAALRTTNGQIYGRLIFTSDSDRQRAKAMGITDFNKIYSVSELASGDDVMFAATGVTDGQLLKGVKSIPPLVHTHSIVMRSKTGVVRDIRTRHDTNLYCF